MVSIIRAESMKLKHTVAKLLIVLVPVIVIACSFLLNPRYMYSMSVNWWYTSFIYFVMALFVALVNQKEEAKLHYYNVYQTPIPLSSVWRAKIYTIVIDTIIMQNVLGILVCIVSMIYMGSVENGIAVTMLAFNLMWLLNIWQVPVYLLLARKLGFYAPIVAAVGILAGGIAFSLKSYWWMHPMTWTDRIMCTVVKYLPNGIPMTEEDMHLCISSQMIAGLAAIAVLMFVVFTFLSSIIFERGQKSC